MYDSVTSQVRPTFGPAMSGTSTPVRSRKRPVRFGEGRVCETFECETVLSTYNRQDVCFLHQPRKVPRLRGIVR